MRRLLAKELLSCATEDPRIVLLTADLGAGMWDEFAGTLPTQFVNCGAAEQAMLDMAVGLALSGKTPICYTITPFFYRGFETIRTYIAHEHLHVILVGSGRDRDYEHDGFSHDASDAERIFETLDITTYFPEAKEEIPDVLRECLDSTAPSFISLRR